MKPKSIVYPSSVILLVLLTGAAIARISGPGLTVQRPVFLETASPVPQEATDRSILSPSFEVLWTAGGDVPEQVEPMFYGPLNVEVGPGGHVFVTDYGSYDVKELSIDGALVRTYGAGQGQGPGEVQGITDILIRPNELFVADPWNQRVLVFDRQGDGIRTIKPPENFFWRIEMLSPDELILLEINTPHLFARVSPEGLPLGSFGALLHSQERHGLVLNGWLSAAGNDRFVYSAYRSSLLASYGADGTCHYLVETIEPLPMAKVYENKTERWADRSARPSSKSISVADGKVYLLSNIRAGVQQLGMVDVYDVDHGSYLYSFRNPAPTYSVIVWNNSMFTVDDTSVTRWSFEVHGLDSRSSTGSTGSIDGLTD